MTDVKDLWMEFIHEDMLNYHKELNRDREELNCDEEERYCETILSTQAIKLLRRKNDKAIKRFVVQLKRQRQWSRINGNIKN